MGVVVFLLLCTHFGKEVYGEMAQTADCTSITQCTADSRFENSSRKTCLPDILQDSNHRILFSVNIIIIMVIGILGNGTTLIAVPYAYFRYRDDYVSMWSPVTFLMLHLSFCDLLYATLGLPSFLLIYSYGYFPLGLGSELGSLGGFLHFGRHRTNQVGRHGPQSHQQSSSEAKHLPLIVHRCHISVYVSLDLVLSTYCPNDV